MEVKNLENIDFNTLYRGFEDAFSDYDVSFGREELHSMLIRRGFDPRHSFAAFDNHLMVAFAFNGTGIFSDIPTAYDIASGTVPDYRRQGILGKILTDSLPLLRADGIRQYLLEVLQSNHKAISLYLRSGFTVVREFDCYRQSIRLVDIPDDALQKVRCAIKRVDVDRVRDGLLWCDFNPSWQNSIDSIGRGESGLICLGAFIDDEMVGYCVSDPLTGDVAQIAVRGASRRRGVGSRLLQAAVSHMKTDYVKVLNVSSDNVELPAFLASRNVKLSNRQFEMKLAL